MVGAHQQAVALHVDRLGAHAFDRLVIQIRQPDVDREVLEVAQDLDRALRQHRELDLGVVIAEGAWPIRPAIGSADGITPIDRRPDERTGRVAQRFDLLLHRRPVVEDGVRPLEHALAFAGQPVEALAALDDRDAQFLFELTDTAGERRLRHVTGLRGAREVLLARERHQILQLADVHPTFSVIQNADSARGSR